MSLTPVFYVDEVMGYLTSDEYKVLMYIAHKVVGDKIPFDGPQSCLLSIDDLKKGTGLNGPVINNAIVELSTFGLILPTMPPQNGQITWELGPLENVDLKGLANRKQRGS